MFSKKQIFRCAAFVLLITVLCGTFLTAGAEDYAGHFLLSDKDVGHCKRLTGDVVLTVVFVDLPDAPFDQESRQRWTADMDTAMEWLEDEAERYGAQLDIGAQYHTVHVDEEAVHIGDDVSGWAQAVLAADSALPSYWQEGDAATCGPVMFCMDAEGRASAASNPDEDIVEYCLLYKNSEWRSLCHELMHIYGAWDYYTHDEVTQAAVNNFTSSIMLDTDQDFPVDSLTAYIIGWTQELDINAQTVLSATAHLTEDDIWLALTDNTLDGFHIMQDNNRVYTGSLEDGIYHGWGIVRWDEGTFYTGNWSWNTQNGEGVYGWSDGARYVGDFVDGAYHGEGTLVFSDGAFYTGEFVNNQRTGWGTMHWPDGTVYTGEFLNGTYHGQGTLIFSDGTVYTGGFADNVFSGEGTYVWPDGSYYKGAYQDGTYHGYGVYRSIDGTVMEGNWVNGQFVGE